MLSDTHPIENRIAGTRALTLRLPAHVHEALKRAADAEGETEATVLRRALRRELGAQLVESR